MFVICCKPEFFDHLLYSITEAKNCQMNYEEVALLDLPDILKPFKFTCQLSWKENITGRWAFPVVTADLRMNFNHFFSLEITG